MLRPYQEEAIAAVEHEFEHCKSTLVVMATGTGKTVVMSEIARREVIRGGRVLILAHRGELLQQAIEKIHKFTGIQCGLEKADDTSEVGCDEIPYTIVVGSIQSMCRASRLNRFSPYDFSLLLTDEAHHSLSNTYKIIYSHFPKARLLGVTATPDRGDLRSLSEVFETIAYEYSIVDAIKGGWLSPIFVQTVPLRIDLSGVAVQSGDFQAASLGSALDPYLRQICREIKERCHDRKTIVFTPLIATSRKMLSLLGEAGIANVREVNGESEDRKETLEWFAHAPKGCVLLNSMLLTEGYDEPSCDCIVVLRATKVRALFVQMVGRGTRLCDKKSNLLLLDFLWLTASHDLCRPACLLTDDAEVCETITKKQESKGGADIDLSPETLESAITDTVKKREDALAKRLAAQSRKKGKLFDALQFAQLTGVTNLSEVPTAIQENDRPTMEMVDRLERLGFACPGSQTAAEQLLTAYQQRVDSGLSSHKQINRLTAYGFRNVAQWPFAAAKKMMDRIAACGWKVPCYINPETYAP